jgi:hypothetical protein
MLPANAIDLEENSPQQMELALNGADGAKWQRLESTPEATT